MITETCTLYAFTTCNYIESEICMLYSNATPFYVRCMLNDGQYNLFKLTLINAYFISNRLKYINIENHF